MQFCRGSSEDARGLQSSHFGGHLMVIVAHAGFPRPKSLQGSQGWPQGTPMGGLREPIGGPLGELWMPPGAR
jgi:hypothetical protein